MNNPNIVNALIALGIKSGWKIKEGKIVKWWSEKEQPSEKTIQTKLKELQDEYDAQAYARIRKPLYPDIGDQLDDLYKKGAFSDEMAAKIKKVKDDNPKPS